MLVADCAFCFASTWIDLSYHSGRTGAAGSSREVEHTSTLAVEQTAQTAREEPQAGHTLTTDTSTPSAPKKTADATPVGAELCDHVSICSLVL